MTFQHWRRRLQESTAPAYQLIPQLLAEDLESGRLTPRDRLPTIREFAQLLELNYTTVVRAFGEARRRGLIVSRPGLGSYVRGSLGGLKLRAGTGAEMTMNLPPELEDEALVERLREAAAQTMHHAALYDLMRYQDFGGTERERALAAQWLGQWLEAPQPREVLCSPGIHSVLAALATVLVKPGQHLCVEPLVYPGMKAIAAHLGIKLQALEMDAEGLVPRSFEEACRTLEVGALYFCPTIHNPTTTTMPIHRREAIAEVALRYSIPLVEDDAYGMLPPAVPPPVADLAPDLTYYVTGFSKCLGAGLRAAFVRAPGEAAANRLAGALRATTVMGSPLSSSVLADWIEQGLAAEAVQAMRAECAARMAMLAEGLAPWAPQHHPQGFHAWIPLAEGGPDAGELAASLRRQGIGAVAAAAFSTDRLPPAALRLCLGGPLTREDCRRVLQSLGAMLGAVPG
jgi:DNA-binding transcriptional MocR family regulator